VDGCGGCFVRGRIPSPVTAGEGILVNDIHTHIPTRARNHAPMHNHTRTSLSARSPTNTQTLGWKHRSDGARRPSVIRCAAPNCHVQGSRPFTAASSRPSTAAGPSEQGGVNGGVAVELRRSGVAGQSGGAAAKVWSEDEARFYQHVLAQEAAAREMAQEAEEVFPEWEGDADERDFYKTVLAGRYGFPHLSSPTNTHEPITTIHHGVEPRGPLCNISCCCFSGLRRDVSRPVPLRILSFSRACTCSRGMTASCTYNHMCRGGGGAAASGGRSCGGGGAGGRGSRRGGRR